MDFKEFSDIEIQDVIKNLEKELSVETDPANIDVLENELKKTKRIQEENMEKLQEQVREKKDIIENIESEATPIPEEIHYDFPEISYESIDRSPQAINEMLSINKDYVSLAKDGVKLTIQSLFGKYAPAFHAVYDTIQ